MKNLIASVVISFCLAFGAQQVNAQSYNNALGLGVDLGDGPTLVGPQYKHSFDGRNAGNAQVLFGDHITIVGVDYSYNQPFSGANGLWWYVGVGPQLAFYDNYKDKDKDGTNFAIRPAAGIEYKIPTVPLGFHFDWKPSWNLSNKSNFEAGRFTLGFKYILN